MLTKEELERAKQDEERHMKRYFPEAWRFFKREKENICGYMFEAIRQESRWRGGDFLFRFERMLIDQSCPIYPAAIYLCSHQWENKLSFWYVTAIHVQRYKPTLGGWPIEITCVKSPSDRAETKHTIVALRAEDWQI